MESVTTAERFFSERDVTPPSVDALFSALRRGFGQAIPRWLKREVLPGRSKESLTYYYRGHADTSWGLSSTLFRAIQTAGRVTEDSLTEAEAAVLTEMRNQGLGLRMNDGELLMVLQHHGIPTRLLDFCHSRETAMYFAVDDHGGTDGRLFVIGQRRSPDRSFPRILVTVQVCSIGREACSGLSR
jgi:hypothetical protein